MKSASVSKQERARRRELAIKKLAALFGKTEIEMPSDSSEEEEGSVAREAANAHRADDGGGDGGDGGGGGGGGGVCVGGGDCSIAASTAAATADDGNASLRDSLLRVANDERVAERVVVELGPSFWPELFAMTPPPPNVGGGSSSLPAHPPPPPSPPSWYAPQADSHVALRAELDELGFAVVAPEVVAPESACTGPPDEVERVAAATEALTDRGWPAVFVFMDDGAWELISRLWPSAEAVLEEEAVLEPTVYAWRVAPTPPPRQPATSGGRGCGRSGGGVDRVDDGNGGNASNGGRSPKQRSGGGVSGNFGLPHRDYSHGESFENGRRSVVCTWLPLTPATTESGCLHMLPKEHDENFFAKDPDSHLRVATFGKKFGRQEDWEQGARSRVMELRFDLSGARAVPAPPGSALMWEGNVVHWGGRASRRASRRRVSIGCTFRAATAIDGADFSGAKCIERTRNGDIGGNSARLQLSAAQRLMLVCRSLVLYSRWFTLGGAIPSEEFHRAVHHALEAPLKEETSVEGGAAESDGMGGAT